jgi:hypothetical protein
LLHLASEGVPKEIIRLLIFSGRIKINEKNNNGETPLLIAAKNKYFDAVQLLINNKANSNIQDKMGDTSLHKAAMSGEKGIYDFLIKNGADENIENIDHKKASSFLSEGSQEQENLIIMIDTQEATMQGSETTLFKRNLKNGNMPILVFGKHFLKAFDTNYLSEYYIFEFEHNNIGGYLFLPINYLEKKLKSDEVKDLEKNFYKLGFDTNVIKLNRITDYSEEIKKAKPEFSENLFNKEVVYIINQLLLPQNRFIHLNGHGGGPEHMIAGLKLLNAVNLFVVLAKKETQMLVVLSCYFGGQTMFTVQDLFNADTRRLADLLNSPVIYEKYKTYPMIIISETISDLPTTTSKYGDEFFVEAYLDVFNKFQKQEKRLKTVSAKRDFFASMLELPLEITGYKSKLAAKEGLQFVRFPIMAARFPLIRFPGKDAKFYPLNVFDKVFIIDELVVGKSKIKILGTRKEGTTVSPSNTHLVVKNKTYLALFVPYVSMPLQIEGYVPTVISYLPDTNDHLFEEINEISKTSKNFIEFITTFAQAGLRDSIRHDFFLIKQIFTMGDLIVNFPDGTKKYMPHFLYNVLIERGPLDKFKYIFSTEKEATIGNTYKNDPKGWSSSFPDVEKLTAEEFAQYKKNIERILRVSGLESFGKKIE